MDYQKLKEKYEDFTYPMASVTVDGHVFSDNTAHLVLADLQVDLSTGFEASVAKFSVYNIYDQEDKKYLFSQCRKYLLLGSSVEISVGYANQLTKVFVGFISQVRFLHQPGDIHHVEVTAMDVKGMMMANSFARQMGAGNYGDAIREIFRKPVYQKMYEEGIYTQLEIRDTPDRSENQQLLSSSIEMVSESDYEFIVKAAKRFHYEFYIDAGVVHFRKGKDTQESVLLELGMEKGIQYYDIAYDITGLVRTVEVRGMDTARATVVSARKNVSNKISTGNKAKGLINQTSRVVIDANAVTKELAQNRADSIMEDISYRFGTLQCTCIGLPEIMPGHFIRLEGFGEPCDNLFYIEHANHVVSDTAGYETYITAVAAALA